MTAERPASLFTRALRLVRRSSRRPQPCGQAFAVLSAAVVAAVVMAGCQVNTRVLVVLKPGGNGTIGVTVAFDSSAVRAVGGLPNLAGQLQYSDLRAAGWTVSGPVASPDGGASVTVTHRFSDGDQLARLMSDVAGSAAGPKPFGVTVTEGGGFFTDRTVVRGTVDLRCGLACFGDPGLREALGGSLGVAPQPLEQAAGQTPAQVFHFSVALRLPGRAGSVEGHPSVARDGTLTWTVPLGRATLVGAVTESIDWGHVVLVAVASALVLIGGTGGGLLWRRRRRRRPPDDVEVSATPAGDTEALAGSPGEPGSVDPFSRPQV